MSYQDRFWAKVNKTGECWVWNGSRTLDGYGQAWNGARLIYAHRLAFELERGAIPAGLQLDHLCRNPSCVNPDHLEPVTQRENILRGKGIAARNAAKTHCPSGHPYSGRNLIYTRLGQRRCRTCKNAQQRVS